MNADVTKETTESKYCTDCTIMYVPLYLPEELPTRKLST